MDTASRCHIHVLLSQWTAVP